MVQLARYQLKLLTWSPPFPELNILKICGSNLPRAVVDQKSDKTFVIKNRTKFLKQNFWLLWKSLHILILETFSISTILKMQKIKIKDFV